MKFGTINADLYVLEEHLNLKVSRRKRNKKPDYNLYSLVFYFYYLSSSNPQIGKYSLSNSSVGVIT